MLTRLQSNFGPAVLLHLEGLVPLILQREPVADQERAIDRSIFDLRKKIPGVLLQMGLAATDLKALFHHRAERGLS